MAREESSMTGPIVDLRDVTKTYRQGKVEVHALRGIDLAIQPGEFTAIWGPSGSGKTTLFNIIGGLDRATAGKVLVAGRDLSELKNSEMSKMRLHKVGFVFQAYNLVPVLTAYENTELVLALQGVSASRRRKRVLSILKEVGLEGLENRRPYEMSGGQQQRVAVARAVVSEPDIVLADEPTANLDSAAGAALLDMMQELNQSRQTTFLLATHDPRVMDRSRRLVQIVDGKVADDKENH